MTTSPTEPNDLPLRTLPQLSSTVFYGSVVYIAVFLFVVVFYVLL